MKRILKWFFGLIGAILLLIIIASVVVMLLVDRPMVENQMKKALNRHVTIKDINVGIFSIVSGISVDEVMISNFKTQDQLEALKGKPVPADDLFVGMKAFRFKVQLLPLLKKQVSLKELVLYEPKINVVRSEAGFFNYNDLTAPKKQPPADAAAAGKKLDEDKEKKAAGAKTPKAPKDQKPFTADDLPLEILIGKIGVENGLITFVDRKLNQTFQVYNLTAKVHSIEIDPKALEKKNNVRLTLNMGVKTIGQVKTGSVQSFDIGFAVEGNCKPFDPITKLVDPEVALKMGMPYGTMNGMQIFDKLDSVEKLQKYCGKLAFLKKPLVWKNAYVDVWYKSGTVKLTNGNIKTNDFTLAFEGEHNIYSKAVNLDLGMVLDDTHKSEIQSGITKNAGPLIPAQARGTVKPETVAVAAMKPLLNKNGHVYMKYKVTGTLANPNSALVEPKLSSLGDVVKSSIGSEGDAAKDMAKDKAKKGGAKGADKLKKKLF